MPNLSDYEPAVKYGANLDVNVDLADIRDENNNELLELDSVASAVNYTRIRNAATGSAVAINAQGDDTNISVLLGAKGTGIVTVESRSTLTLNAAGTGTINAQAGVLTTPVVAVTSTAYALNITNDKIATTSILFANVGNGTNIVGNPFVAECTPGSGNATVTIMAGSAVALNGTLKVSFLVL